LSNSFHRDPAGLNATVDSMIGSGRAYYLNVTWHSLAERDSAPRFGAATVRSREKMSIRRRNRLRHLEKASVCRGGAGGSACLARARAILSHLLTVAARLQSYGFGVSYRAAISSMHHSRSDTI